MNESTDAETKGPRSKRGMLRRWLDCLIHLLGGYDQEEFCEAYCKGWQHAEIAGDGDSEDFHSWHWARFGKRCP